ncbi:MAG TPA: phosphate ABC transporter ATP-binding protein [Armatimonadota bacterium]
MHEKLSLEHVSKTRVHVGQTVKILSDISASVAPSDIYTILGPSGSGKSTLLRLINRLDDPSSGRILLDGQDINSFNVLSLRRRAGMVFQSAAVFDGTVDDNIQYGARLTGRKLDSAELLRRVGLPEEFVTRDAASLSGGEQQRISIARTLATNPDILLMDEPTSSLDPAARIQIEDLVLKMNSDGLTIVFVTHDMEQAERIGTRTMLLVGGEKIEEAPTSEFFLNPQTEAARLFIDGKLV